MLLTKPAAAAVAPPTHRAALQHAVDLLEVPLGSVQRTIRVRIGELPRLDDFPAQQ